MVLQSIFPVNISTSFPMVWEMIEVIDYDKVAALAKEHKPKLIVAGDKCLSENH